MCRIMEELIHDEKMEIAKNILAKGAFSPEIIAECVGISVDEVKRLQAEQKSMAETM